MGCFTPIRVLQFKSYWTGINMFHICRCAITLVAKEESVEHEVELKLGKERNGIEGHGGKGRLPCSRLAIKRSSVFPGLQK